jgi:hypothetical protein
VNADLSVAPEIARLAAPLALWPASPPRLPGSATTGQLATALSRLAASPQQWWDLVRFNPDRLARIAVPGPIDAWLLVIPPGQVAECHCQLATQVAGDAAEGAGDAAGAAGVPGLPRAGGPGMRRLRPGRVVVHAGGAGHVIRAVGPGYSVTLHAGPRR